MTKKCSLYILSLLAGKFGKICTAFPLTTFLRKKLKRLPFRNFLTQKFQWATITKIPAKKTITPPRTKRKFVFSLNILVLFFEQNICQINCQFLIWNDFTVGFVRDDASKTWNNKPLNFTFWNKTDSQNASRAHEVILKYYAFVSLENLIWRPIDFELEMFIACHFISWPRNFWVLHGRKGNLN